VVENKREQGTNRPKGCLSSCVSWPSLVTVPFTGDVAVCAVTFTSGGDVTGCDLTPVGRGMPRAPVPFFGCGGTPHGRGSSAE
jgi:hypothetical protein